MAKPFTYDKKLEGLRGLCALTVAMAHLFTFRFINSDMLPAYNIFTHLHFARVAVLLFFIISGYVIGANHLQTPFNVANVKSYLKKRAVRLYPIYIIALIISFAISANAISVPQILAHVFFMQEFWVKTISSNVVLWSLSYEVIYYLLFVGLWAYHNSNRIFYFLFIIPVIAYTLFGTDTNIIKSVLTGWLFWLVGLYISQKSIRDITGSQIISYLVIMLCTYNLNTGDFILKLFHSNYSSVYNINITDLAFLPVCTLITIEITNKYSKYLLWLKLLVYAIPTGQVCLLLYFKHNILADLNWEFGIIYWVLSLALLAVKTNIYWFEKLNSIGKISYAIYIFHFPVAYFLTKLLGKYLSGYTLLITGVGIWLIATWLLALSTEIILQKKVKAFFFTNSMNKNWSKHAKVF